MAQAVSRLRAEQARPASASPFIVELVGPAGAGKTTLSRALTSQAADVVIAPDIELRRPGHLPRFLKQVPFWAPVYMRGAASSRQLNWSELKYITYLREWAGLLRNPSHAAGRVVLLDHGPVFRMATLREFGPAKLKSPVFEKWWERLYRQWAFSLDLIVWLDTSDDILTERINARHQHHAMKGRPASETAQFLMRYRMSYRYTLERLMQYGPLALLQFDTRQVPVQAIARQILASCKS